MHYSHLQRVTMLRIAGSRGDHKSRMGSELLKCLFDQHVMELLLLMAQHTARVRVKLDCQRNVWELKWLHAELQFGFVP